MIHDEFEIEHKGLTYYVNFCYTRKRVDDSFDGHQGGVVHTFEDHHWEVDDFDIESVCDDDGDEIDYELIPGLDRAIEQAIRETEV